MGTAGTGKTLVKIETRSINEAGTHSRQLCVTTPNECPLPLRRAATRGPSVECPIPRPRAVRLHAALGRVPGARQRIVAAVEVEVVAAPRRVADAVVGGQPQASAAPLADKAVVDSARRCNRASIRKKVPQNRGRSSANRRWGSDTPPGFTPPPSDSASLTSKESTRPQESCRCLPLCAYPCSPDHGSASCGWAEDSEAGLPREVQSRANGGSNYSHTFGHVSSHIWPHRGEATHRSPQGKNDDTHTTFTRIADR